MVAIGVFFALAGLLTWRPLRAAIPSESLLAAVMVGSALLLLLHLGHVG